MARLVRLTGRSAGDWPSALVAELQSSSLVLHAYPDHWSFESLQTLGVTCQAPPQGELPAGALLVLPDSSHQLENLVQLAHRLLAPGGCPWDRAQTHATLKKYLIEEAYELCDAIDSDNPDKMLEELGDVLLQPIMHAHMSAMAGGFGLEDVAAGIASKLVRRHPHVFGEAEAADPDAVLRTWDAVKRQERGNGPSSVLEGVPRSMPSLMLAMEVSKRAARNGFEWADMQGVLDKLQEELEEFQEAVRATSKERASEELGDLLFTIVNVARWLKLDPEDSLRTMVGRFRQRFSYMEEHATKPLAEMSPGEWDDLWEASKAQSH